jgi:oxygen-independent coproporphyrinogen-3 oxidase
MSVGVQDFDENVQKAVNRIQSEDETRAVIDAARANGFKSISIDLIYGLPRQTVEGFDRTLDRVLAASPDRLSIYNYAHLPTCSSRSGAFSNPTCRRPTGACRSCRWPSTS